MHGWSVVPQMTDLSFTPPKENSTPLKSVSQKTPKVVSLVLDLHSHDALCVTASAKASSIHNVFIW